MKKQKAPSFPFYYRDWWHATRRWSDAMKIEYLELLCDQADSPTGSIGENIFDANCKIPEVLAKFEKDKAGYFNPRMRDILNKRDLFLTKQSQNARKRWDKSGNAVAMPLEKGNRKTEKGNKNTEKGIRKRTTENTPLVFPFTDEDFIHHWQVWKDFKKEQFGFKYKPIGEQSALKKIGEISGMNSEVACRIIAQSISNGWKGLFQVKGDVSVSSDALASYMNRVSNLLTDK